MKTAKAKNIMKLEYYIRRILGDIAIKVAQDQGFTSKYLLEICAQFMTTLLHQIQSIANKVTVFSL